MPGDRQYPWFAVQTRPQHEKAVARQLAMKDYEVFLPTYRARRQWSDRFKVIVLPLFEGYLFCRLDLEKTSRVITTTGILRLVGVAGTPAPIDEVEIEALQKVMRSMSDVQQWPYLQIGHRVRIESGPLAGVEGILESERGRHRIIVSVTLLHRSVAVEIDRDVVGPVETTSLRHLAAARQ